MSHAWRWPVWVAGMAISSSSSCSALTLHLPTSCGSSQPTLPAPLVHYSQHPFVGLLFMVGALVMETVLFIIRTSVPPKLHLAAARRATAARVARQAERQRQEAAALEGEAAGGAEGAAAAGSKAAAGGQAARGGGKGGAARGMQPAKPASEKKED